MSCSVINVEQNFIMWMYHILSIHSIVGGHVGCSHLVIANNAALSMLVYASFWTWASVSLEYIPGSEIVGSQHKSIVN